MILYDHLKSTSHRNRLDQRQKRLFVDWISFSAKLSGTNQLDSAQIDTTESIEAAVAQLTKEINDSIKEATRIKIITVIPNKFMILPAHIVKKIKAKRLARRNYQKYGDLKFKTEFNRLTFEIKESIKNFNQEKWRSFCNSLNLHNMSDSKLWNKLNSIDKDNNEKPPKIPLISINNTTIDNPKEISNIFAETLAKAFSDPKDPNSMTTFKNTYSKSVTKSIFSTRMRPK